MNPTSTLLPITPQDLGFPSKFSEWRPYQDSAIVRGIDSERRFVAQSLPTGGGKSGDVVAQALLSGRRTAILTSTKGLQDQYLHDFSGLGLTDIRGRANYACRMAPGMTCEDGAHARCPHNGGGNCQYHCARQKALASPLVVTNYSYWALIHRYGEGLGRFDMLVLDEAHNAPDEVCEVMSVHITSEECFRMLRTDFPPDDASLEQWKDWARSQLPDAQQQSEALGEYLRQHAGMLSQREIKEVAKWKALVGKLQTVAEADGEWVAEAARSKTGGYRLDPVWASHYAERIMFLGIPHVLLVSATIIPKTLNLLGIPEEEVDYQEYPSMFPADRSPLYYIPTIWVSHKTLAKESYLDLWLRRIDQIVEDRLDRKGIIHTVSYDRKDLILSRSEFAEFMLSHKTADAMAQAEYFRRIAPPAILLSPSMSTGYDYPYDTCEYQILCKVPYPDTRSRIMQARTKGDDLYGPYITVQSLVQACGRGMRADNDQCENFIIDDHIKALLAGNRDLFPGWFVRLYKRRDSIPRPFPKLLRTADGRWERTPKSESD